MHLQRITHELKSKHRITIKDLSRQLSINYNYLTKQISGSVNLSDSVYDKVVQYAKTKGVDTTVYTTRTTEPAVQESVVEYNSEIHSQIITLRVKMVRNKIAGVEWDLTTN